MPRVRTHTEKGKMAFEERLNQFETRFKEATSRLHGLCPDPTSLDQLNLKQLTSIKRDIDRALENYESDYEEFSDFLKRTSTQQSLQIEENVQHEFKILKNSVKRLVRDIDSKIVDLSEQLSTSSNHSRSSSKSKILKAKLLCKFSEEAARLEKAQADLDYHQSCEEAKRDKMRSELRSEFHVLKQRQQVAMLEFEDNDNYNQKVDDLEITTPNQKVTDFIKNSETSATITPNHLNIHAPEFKPNSQLDMSKFLLKKELTLSRLVQFNEKPETFIAWKASFKRVMEDLSASADEEFDMLIKYLGQESKRHAISLKSVYITNLVMGLTKLWSRLDHQYGSPELVKTAILNKLNALPKLNPKNPAKLYDLVDILLEVQALKEDPRYALQLSYFDSSEGVLPIIHKLPYNLQEKWVNRASGYKRNNDECFPPFSIFVDFVSETAKTKNDPALALASNDFKFNRTATAVSVKKTEVQKSENQSFKCPIHKADHPLVDCRAFLAKPVSERKQIVKENHICFRCLSSVEHRAADCRIDVKCTECNSHKHHSLMHENRQHAYSSKGSYGGERGATNSYFGESTTVQNKCTKVCGTKSITSKSCAKIVLVDFFEEKSPSRRLRTYAIIDEQSNRSLVSPLLLDKLGLMGELTEYTLSSCSGPSSVQGRKVTDCMVETLDKSCRYMLPSLLECNQIPNARDEIPTSEIARQFTHLQRIASKIPPLDNSAEILLLIGRDLITAHHVHEQITGPKDEPFAQRLGLGWVIIGQVCLGQIHKEEVNCKKTYLLPNGRESTFPPCDNNFKVREDLQSLTDNVFVKTREDESVSLSREDKEFIDIMDTEMVKSSKGNWVAPLPFISDRPSLPNNRSIVLKRAHMLHSSLMKSPKKLDHFLEFMEEIINKGNAELAPIMKEGTECWYLPLFGVYHPKKPDKIRGVFDASAKFENLALNDVLLQGPDLINSLLGILLRFRKDKIAICADIQQMFYSFLVKEEDRDFLRFFWYKDNDHTKDIIEYRMCVHVFGNKPSPSVANFGLRKTANLSEAEFGSDVKKFISENFYVDDGLVSLPTVEETVDLMKRTQTALSRNGNLRLHKIASNDENVLKAFPQEDLVKDLSCLDLSKDTLPTQRSLGLLWDLKSDCFTFSVPDLKKPFSRRGVLSVVNSLYDPLGFVAPVTIVGKSLLQNMISGHFDWDEPLPKEYYQKWQDWSESLYSLKDISIPRCYFDGSLSQASHNTLLVFSDASEKAIASVAYLVSDFEDARQTQIGFVFGKTKVAPSKGHTIPRLELCAAVLAVEITEQILSQLQVSVNKVQYFTDSKVVLGYICNTKRRFYTYVTNRVEKILCFSKPSQWSYVDTKHNPADVGTRGVSPCHMPNSVWLRGPSLVVLKRAISSDFDLQNPNNDKEVRPDVTCLTTNSVEFETRLKAKCFEKFSSFKKLTRAVTNLQHICKSFNKSCQCVGWHICRETSAEDMERTQSLIFQVSQKDSFPTEIECLRRGSAIPQSSSLLNLNPFMDEMGVLRIGGRLNNSTLPTPQKNPIIVHGKSHLAWLLIHHFHEKVLHQGRHFTEGAIREGGFWLTGGKKRVSSFIFSCVKCRKLRAKNQSQIMADLPVDRLTPAPPFTYVGVDVFGPWSILTRKTRGGQSCNKRWAVLFTCLTIRAIHIEIVEEMSSSAFINALRRFISIRGNVLQFRSDRGTNFVGATADLGIEAINVEDCSIKDILNEKGTTWVFNPPHASHMGGVWERMIGIVRRALDAILTTQKLQNLTHDALATLMAEVCAIVNARPLVPVSQDADTPEILSPSMLLTQKSSQPIAFNENLSIKDIYRAEWKKVQFLSDQFWVRWKSEFLSLLQTRKKWTAKKPNLKVGDVVLLKDSSVTRNQWPLARIVKVFPSKDNLVRTVQVRSVSGDRSSLFVRPVTELVLLLNLIKTVLEGPVDTQVLIETVVKEQIALLLPAAIGLLAAILVPVFTVIFCCCRCCGNCGSTLTTGDVHKQGTTGLICNGIVILAAVGIVFAAASCVPSSGTRVKNSPKVVVDSLQHGAHDIPIFVSSLVEESKVVVADHLNGTIKSIKDILVDLPHVLSEPLLDSTSGYITYIEDDVHQIIQAVDSLGTVETETNETVETILQHVTNLELTLNDLNTNLTTIKNKCVTDGEVFCDMLPDGSTDPINYDVAPLTDLTATITELVNVTKNVNLTGYLAMGNETFATIPGIIYNSSKDTIEDVMEALDSVPETVLPTVYSTLDIVGNMTDSLGLDEMLDDVDAEIESIDATIDPIFNMAMKAVGVYIGLIGGLALAGAVLGCACRGNYTSPNYGRNNMTACGATCLMCSVFLAASSILIVLLLGSLFLVVGGNLSITCKTVQDVTIVEKLIENEILFNGDNLGKIILDNENINISVQAFIGNCRDRGTLFSSFNVSEMVNLTDIFNSSSFVPNLDNAMYDSINVTIQDINVFDTAFLNDVSSQLAFPENSSADSIQELKDSVAEVDLLQMSQNFTNLADTLTVEWYSNYFRTMAQRLAYVHQYTKMPLQEAIVGLEMNLNDLNGTGADIQNAVGDLNITLSSMQGFIQTQAVTVMFQSIDDFLASMLSVPDEFINNILHTLSTDVGECLIIGEMYDSITGSFCVYFLDSFNALWGGLYSAGMVFIFLMIASCRIGQHFRRPNAGDGSQVQSPRGRNTQGNNRNYNAQDIHIKIEHPHRQAFDSNNNNSRLFETNSKVQMMKNFLTRKRGMFKTGTDSPQLLRIKKLSENLRLSRESRDMMLYQNPLHLYQSIELRSDSPEESPESQRSVNLHRIDDQQPGTSKSGQAHVNTLLQKNHLEGKNLVLLESPVLAQTQDVNNNGLEYENTVSKVPNISTATLCGSFQDLHPSDLKQGVVNNCCSFEMSDSESLADTSMLVGITGCERDYLEDYILTPTVEQTRNTGVSNQSTNNIPQPSSSNAKITCALCKNPNSDNKELGECNMVPSANEFHSYLDPSCTQFTPYDLQQQNDTVDRQDPETQSKPIQAVSRSLEAHLNDFEDLYLNLSLENPSQEENERQFHDNRGSSNKVKQGERKYPRNSGKVLDIQVRPYTEKARLEALENMKKTSHEMKSLDNKVTEKTANEIADESDQPTSNPLSYRLQDTEDRHAPHKFSHRESSQILNMHAYEHSAEPMDKILSSRFEKMKIAEGSLYQKQITELSTDLRRCIAISENSEEIAVKSLKVLSSEALLEGALPRVIPHQPIQTYGHASTAKQSSKITYM